MENHPGSPVRITVPGPHRSVELQDERDRIEAAELRERASRFAALVATCAGPLYLLRVTTFHWESQGESSWFALLIFLVAAVALLWLEWLDAVDEVTDVLREENRLLPNRLGPSPSGPFPRGSR